MLIGAARHLPEVTVQVVGVPADQAEVVRRRYGAPANVELLPPRPREALAEGVPGRVGVRPAVAGRGGSRTCSARAMCSGCIPVGSPVFGIPETIGDTGYLVDGPEPEHVAGVLRRALGEGHGRTARGRPATASSPTTRAPQRRERLRAVVDEVVGR